MSPRREAFLLRNGLRSRTFLLLCGLVLLPLCWLGYGSDNDTFAVLEAGRVTWHLHLPTTSRNPGYWLYEAIVFVLSSVGGYVATNLVTLLAGLVVVLRFLVIAVRLGVRFPLLVAGALVATPVFAIACTSTDDYVWSLLGIVLFAELLLAERFALAVLPAAFAIAIRGANGVAIAGAILAAALTQRRRATRILGCGAAAFLLGALPYVESYRIAGHTFAFTHALAGPAEMWSVKLMAGRFLLKALYLYGPIATVILLGCHLFVAGSSRRPGEVSGPPNPYRAAAIPIFLGIIAANLLLFLRYPIEVSYLIPAAFFGLLLLAITVLTHRAVAAAFLAAVFSLNLITPQIVEPNLPGLATGARLHFALKRGVTLEDIRLRTALRGCDNIFCYYAHFHPNGPGLIYSGPDYSRKP